MKPALRPLVMATAFACVVGCAIWPTLARAVLGPPWIDAGQDVPLPLVLLLVFGAAVLSGRRMSTRAGADAAIVALATSLSILSICVAAMHVTITLGEDSFPGGLWEASVVSLQGASSPLLFPLFAAMLARSLRSTAWLRGARFGAYAALFGLVGFLGAAMVVSRRAPSRMQYVSSLPVFARLPAQTQLGSRSSASESDRLRDVIPLGDVTLVRDCSGRRERTETWCTLGVVRSVQRGAPSAATLDAAPKSMAYVRNGDELRVRLDGARDLLIVNDVIALDLRALRPRSIGPWNLVPVLAPPRAWITFAATGLVLSLALLLATRRRRAPEPVEATLRPDGALVLDGRALTGVAVPPEVAPGPVVVFLAQHLGALHYRDDAPQSGARVEAGTLADHRARVTARASMWAAIAWSVTALAGAPLAAWAQGAVTALATRRALLPALAGAAAAVRGALRGRRRAPAVGLDHHLAVHPVGDLRARFEALRHGAADLHAGDVFEDADGAERMGVPTHVPLGVKGPFSGASGVAASGARCCSPSTTCWTRTPAAGCCSRRCTPRGCAARRGTT
jgi:hypothetical protein